MENTVYILCIYNQGFDVFLFLKNVAIYLNINITIQNSVIFII